MRTPSPGRVEGCLLDLDGTVYEAGAPIAGAVEALARLRAAGLPLLFLTNTTRRPRRALAERLLRMGIEARTDEILNAPLAAANWLRHRGVRRVFPLLAEAALEDLPAVEIDHQRAEVVLIGDLGPDLRFEPLDRAFRALMAGAELVALQKNRYWRTARGLSLDAGAFVAALEFASGKTARVVGKPAEAFFRAAVDRLAVPADRLLMVGDDLAADIAGARAVDIPGVLVRTGKFRPGDEAGARRVGAEVLGSLAELPGWLGVQGSPSSPNPR